MTRLELSILKELDRKNFRSHEISFIMKKLTNKTVQSKLLDYLIENRFEIITINNIINVIKNYKTVLS